MTVSRRALLSGGLAAVLGVSFESARAADMVAVRSWPNADYTRVTIELTDHVRFKHFMVRSPKPVRLVVDVKNLRFTEKFKSSISKVSKSDPYISAIRAAQFDPETVRIVIDLKRDATPVLFESEPNSQYKYRLIFDIHPAGYKPDAVDAAIAASGAAPASGSPAKHAAGKTPAKSGPKQAVNKPPPRGTGRLVVVIDAGHGGEDPGAVGRARTCEKHVTLAIAYRLKALFDKDPKFKPLMTRKADVFVPLGKRVRFAMANKASLFVSIHADAWTSPKARGTSAFALSQHGATSNAARWLAQSQNEADIIGGVDISKVETKGQQTFLDMNAEWKTLYSLEMGYFMLNRLGRINTLHNKKVEQAQFLVLKTPSVPSILVESAFISNPDEEKKLKTSSYQQKVAQAIYDGIRDKVARDPIIGWG